MVSWRDKTHPNERVFQAILTVGAEQSASVQVVERVGLESSLGSTGFGKMVAKDFEPEEEGSMKISPSGDAVVEAEAIRLFSKSFRKNLTTMV